MPKDTASSQVWTVGKLVQAVNTKPGTDTRVVVPKFQRRLVWKEEQKLRLIESIYRGYPIGAILLTKRPADPGGGDVYQVVDGLQRTSTLVRFVSEPLTWAPADLLPPERMERLSLDLEVDAADLEKTVLDWLRKTKKTTFTAGFKPDKLADVLQEAFPHAEALVAARADDLSALLDDIKSNVDISSHSLPIVTYSGPEAELPEIFERVNQSGTKLSKYEVFAATWLNSSGTQINTEGVRVAINDKYTALLDRGFAIDGLEGDQSIRDYNLFEYLFGFGKVLVRDHSLLFTPRPDAAEAEPAAFSLTCVARGHQLSAMKALPQHMPVADDGVLDPTDMERAIRIATSAVEQWLRPFIGLRLNASPGGGLDFAHGELQIVSMIARAAAGRWNSRDDWSEMPDWQSDWDRLKRSMPQHYLLDLLQETWRGPIYTTLFNRVWATDDDGSVTGPSPTYAEPVPGRRFVEVLDAWFEGQLSREQRNRPYVRSIDRTFLRFVYSDLVSHKMDTAVQFELEHLYPVSRLKKVIAASGGPGWPISSIANLALFTKSLNREKSSKTISEHLRSTTLPPDEAQALQKLLLCDVEDVSMDNDTFTREEYLRFLRVRWAVMRAQVASNLSIDMP